MSEPVLWETGSSPALWESGGPVLWRYTSADLIEVSAPMGGPTLRSLASSSLDREWHTGAPLRAWQAGAPTVEP